MRTKKPEPRYTLQELAAAANMTVRNVRAYQTRGLIPPPARQGRNSVYSATHLARLNEIREARARGATLTLIGTHLSHGGSLASDALDATWLPRTNGSRNAHRTNAPPVRPATISALTSTDPASDGALTQLVEAGVVQRNGKRLVADRSLTSAVNSLVRRGIPIQRTLDVASAAVDAGRTVADALEAALASSPCDDRARRELMDLAARVLSTVVSNTVVTIDLAGSEHQPTPS